MGYYVKRNMSILNKKISLPLLLVFLGAAIGALSGQFVWTLVAAVGAGALLSVVQNLSTFHRTIDGRERGMSPDTSGVTIKRSSDSPNWLNEWDDEVLYSPAYKGTPANIWNKPVSASED